MLPEYNQMTFNIMKPALLILPKTDECPATQPTVLFPIRISISPSKSLAYKTEDNFFGRNFTEVSGGVSEFY